MEGDIWGISGRLIIRSGVHLVLAMQTHEYHLTGPSTSLYNQYENTAVLTGGCPKGWTVLLKGYVILKRKLVRVSEKSSLPLNCSCLPLLNTAWCITSAFHYWGQERAAGFVKLQDSKFLGCCNHILGCFQLSSHIRENRRIKELSTQKQPWPALVKPFLPWGRLSLESNQRACKHPELLQKLYQQPGIINDYFLSGQVLQTLPPTLICYEQFQCEYKEKVQFCGYCSSSAFSELSHGTCPLLTEFSLPWCSAFCAPSPRHLMEQE